MRVEDIDNMSVISLIAVTKTSIVPAFARKAAVRLYELGKKDYATNFLIKQMNQYKRSGTPNNIITETCPEAAKELGKLRDERAIEPLFEALGELGFGPAYGLAELNGPAVEKRLSSLANKESNEGVYAAIALGYMKNDLIVPRLIRLLENHEYYIQTIHDKWIFRLRNELLIILGAYNTNSCAKKSFADNVQKKDISWILSQYIHQEEYPSKRWLEWEIAVKYGWNDYIVTTERKFAFRHLSIKIWSQYSDAICPFATEIETEQLRNIVLDEIWKNLSSKYLAPWQG